MTTTVELIEFLKAFPPDTEVEVLSGKSGQHYAGDYFSRQNLELPDLSKFDFGEGDKYMTAEYVEFDPYGKMLFLGSDD